MEFTSQPLLAAALSALLGYLIGSLSFAVIISRLFRLDDPRTYGSGNPGATNVLRSGHKGAAILTLVFDALKAWLPVVVAQRMGLADTLVALVGLGAFLGHLWPVFFRFEGGKGVATAAGALLAFDPVMGGLSLLVWIGVAAVWRYSSLASLSAAVAAPLWQAWLHGTGPVLWAVATMSALLAWRHRANIGKLRAGQESKIGQKAKAAAPGA